MCDTLKLHKPLNNRLRQLMQVVVLGILPDLYKDLRILLGWAWTYLIVAELIGTASSVYHPTGPL